MATKRECGDCQLCCRLLPMKETGSAAGERCRYQKHGVGCRIYARRPACCALWNCVWLSGELDARRPDRSHYVVDIMPDYVDIVENATGKRQSIPVHQVWVDPLYPDAHRDAALRAWLAREGERGVAAIVRLNERDGFVLFPPAMAEDRQWHEEGGNFEARAYSLANVVEKIGRPVAVEVKAR